VAKPLAFVLLLALLAVYGLLLYGVWCEAGPSSFALAVLILARLEMLEVFQGRLRKNVHDLAEAGGELATVCGQYAAVTTIVDQRLRTVEASLDRDAGLN